MTTIKNWNIDLIKLIGGERLLRLTYEPLRLLLEKRLDPNQAVVRQKEELFAIISSQFIFGVPSEQKPFRSNQEGKVRYRFRNDDYAKVYIKSNGQVRGYYLLDREGFWTVSPEFCFAVNVKVN